MTSCEAQQEWNATQRRWLRMWEQQRVTPRNISAKELIALVGERHAIALCQTFGRSRLPDMEKFLLARRNQAIIKDHQQGWPIRWLAQKYGLDRASVQAVLRKNPLPASGRRGPRLRALIEG